MRADQWFQALGYKVTSPFGSRPDPFGSGDIDFHRGIDYGGQPVGAKITTPTGGIITHAVSSTGWGKIVRVEDAKGCGHLFAHLDQFKVKMGAEVRRGDLIGTNGKTGPVTGPHLHYQVNKPGTGIRGNGYFGDPNKYVYWEDESLDTLIVINTENDRGVAVIAEWQLKAPVIQLSNLRQSLLDKTETVIQIGGPEGAIKHPNVIRLSGETRLETAEAVMRYLKGK
jgi:murein DD-endopeptidase MepM/ murein hydrolase activator NlpD